MLTPQSGTSFPESGTSFGSKRTRLGYDATSGKALHWRNRIVSVQFETCLVLAACRSACYRQGRTARLLQEGSYWWGRWDLNPRPPGFSRFRSRAGYHTMLDNGPKRRNRATVPNSIFLSILGSELSTHMCPSILERRIIVEVWERGIVGSCAASKKMDCS